MPTSKILGSISSLWRFPVKSMGGEQLMEVEVTERGVLGDRAYALIDMDTGKVVSAKSVKLFPNLFECSAAFVDTPHPGDTMPAVQITLPEGTSVRSDSDDVDSVLSAYFKRNLTLAQVAPNDYTVDQYHPDVEGADPRGIRDNVIDQPLGAALFSAIGQQSPIPVGSFLDAFPISLLTSATLARLGALQPTSQFDERRFRMNVNVKTKKIGFIENDWVGHKVVIGDSLHLSVAMPDARCVMTTLAQGDLPRDNNVIRTLVQHNKLQVGELGQFPCAGVYAVVAQPGIIRVGDQVALNSSN
jgi:uncharacterized protein YcbX